MVFAPFAKESKINELLLKPFKDFFFFHKKAFRKNVKSNHLLV